MADKIMVLTLPRYGEIPRVGLYLEQVVKYVNELLVPMRVEITASMVSNYVKKGYIDRPVKKQYNEEQIAYIIFIAIAKQVLSMENIAALFALQKSTYDLAIAYNFFCEELNEMLLYLFEEREASPQIPRNAPFAKKTLRSVVTAVAHIIYLKYYMTSEEKGIPFAVSSHE